MSNLTDYAQRLSSTEICNGFVLPYAAITIAGKGGATATLLITFMAVTSTLFAQVIAVSSIISFDVYRTYINKRATDIDVMRWSHYGVMYFEIFSAASSTLLHYVGVDFGWMLYTLGTFSASARKFVLTFFQEFLRVLVYFPQRSQSYGGGRAV